MVSSAMSAKPTAKSCGQEGVSKALGEGGEGGETHAVGCDGEVPGSLFVELDGEGNGDVRSNVVVLLHEFRVSFFSQNCKMEP